MRRISPLCIIILAALPCAAAAEVYLWPMHGPRRISSNFAEYRDGHFHAGLDLRTFGKRGLPCLAVGDGRIVRVRVAPGGYGKAVYLRLDDGRTAVYAHVDDFTWEVDSLAYHWRRDRESSWCDLSMLQSRYRFGVGDTICYSGATGTTAPHLHFELRDEEGRPFNPLEGTFVVEDAQPPIISGLAVIPADPGGRVNGSPATNFFDFMASRGTGYTIADTLVLEGHVGFAVSVWDEQGFGQYRMAPIEVRLDVDGQTAYRIRNGLFGYDETGQIELEYVVAGEGPPGRYLVLFRKQGNTLGGRVGAGVVCAGGAPGSGALGLDEGVHRIEIIAADAAGNESRARFYCSVGSAPAIEVARKLDAASEVIVASRDPSGASLRGRLYESTDGGDTWIRLPLEPYGRYYRAASSAGDGAVYRYVSEGSNGRASVRHFSSPAGTATRGSVYCEIVPQIDYAGLVVRIITDRLLVDDPPLRMWIQGAGDTIFPVRVGPREFHALVGPERLADGTNVFVVEGRDHGGRALRGAHAGAIFGLRRGHSRSFTLDDSVLVEMEPKHLWCEGLCRIDECPMPGPPPGGSSPVASCFSIEFHEDRIQDLLIRCDPGQKTGLFRWEGAKGWKCVGMPAMEGGAVTIPTGGIYAFFSDGLPPDFRTVAMERTERGSGFYRDVTYYVPVTEEGCGVDPYAASAQINGEPVVCEWDEPRSRLYVPIPASMPAGPVTLRVDIADRAGNRSAGEFGFVIQ